MKRYSEECCKLVATDIQNKNQNTMDVNGYTGFQQNRFMFNRQKKKEEEKLKQIWNKLSIWVIGHTFQMRCLINKVTELSIVYFFHL